MRVVIVGNGKPTANYSDIDHADVIVRLNNARHYKSSLVGTRTTVLMVRAASHPHGQLVANGPPEWQIPKEVISQVERLLVVDTRSPIRDVSTGQAIHPYEHFILRHKRLENVLIDVVPVSFADETRRVAETNSDPTIGTIAINWALQEFGSPIEIAGFEWNTTNDIHGHNYEAEQRWIEDKLRDGQLIVAHREPAPGSPLAGTCPPSGHSLSTRC